MRLRSGNGCPAVVAVLLSTAAVPVLAQSGGQGGPTSAMDDRWQFTIAPYVWMSGIKGDISW